MNAEERLEKVLAKLKSDLQDKNNNLTETERLEYVAELMSIVNQRLEELGETHE
jgi:hypothetical protein